MLPLAPIAQLLGTAYACGLSLYGTIALLGLASRLDWFAGMPAGLRGLENGLVIGSAAALYIIEFVIDKIRHVDSVWDAIHTLVRPLTAALLTLLALSALPIEHRVAGAAAAGLTAFAAHATKAGFRVALNARPRQRLRVVVSLFENILAVGLVIAALTFPQLALAALAALGIGMLRVAPPLWRAALLGARATAARFRGFFGSPGWRNASGLPSNLRRLLAPQEVGSAPVVATRAALVGLRGAGAYRNGWLVLEHGEPAFLFRSRLRSRRMDLPRSGATNVREGLLTDMVDIETDSKPFTLFLLKDGPPASIALAEILRG